MKGKQPQVVKATQPPPPKGKSFDANKYVTNATPIDKVNQIKQSFDLFDTDGGGTVSMSQIKAAMTSLGFQSKNGLIFQMLMDLDEDGSGQIEFDQFFHLMTSRLGDKDAKENIKKLFALYDDEKTGYLSVNNLRRVVNHLDLPDKIEDQELESMITLADEDGDGLVSQEEFYKIITKAL